MNKEEKISKVTKELIEVICKLEPQEFIGVCKILNIPIIEEVENEGAPAPLVTNETTLNDFEATGRASTSNISIRKAEDLVPDVINKITQLNRTRKRNLLKLLKPAVKGR